MQYAIKINKIFWNLKNRILDTHMKHITLFYVINFIYMEFIFHLYFWKDIRVSIFPALAVIAVFSLLQSFLLSFLKGRANRIFFWIFLVLDYLLYASQMVYRTIFKQPLLLDAAVQGGGDALTNFWREALQGIVDAGLGLAALALGILWTIISMQIWKPESVAMTGKRVAAHLGCIAGACVVLYGSMFSVFKLSPDLYTEYQEFGYPDDVLERFGVSALFLRDVGAVYLPEEDVLVDAFSGNAAGEAGNHNTDGDEQTGDNTDDQNVSTETGSLLTGTEISTEEQTTEHSDTTETVAPSPEPTCGPQILDVDVEYLKEIGSDDVDKITDYVLGIEPTKENDYTGMFEGYNFIYLTAEGFSTAAIDENLTPTLYKLTNSGVVVPEYYVPLWQTSTSDGEYVNLTGLIPDQQFSMKRSAENSQPFSLANYFKAEGAACYAYHNNTLSYYDRHLSHPNLGYTFKASKLGDLEEAEWGNMIFQMEHPGYWPSSDLEMIQATLPEYINEERFHVYYMTVSGHMNYNFKGNMMSSIHREEVSNLPYSEEGRAYIACNIELDRALQCLIEQLEAADRLKDTVICLSADHYPYGMNLDNYEELTGMNLENNTLDIYRNSLILWNSEMETVVVEKPCSALDLMPTILNLFGFDFDSRLYSGRDIFSDSAPLVVFSNRSFITDVASYNKKTGEVVSRNGEPVSEEYISEMKNYVKMLHKHSAGIINNNYYHYYEQAISK